MRFLDDLKITLPYLPGARCADSSIPPDVFHPEGREGLAAVLPTVKKICNSCPSKKACLEYALDQKIFDGIWAGTTGKQRRQMVAVRKSRRKGKKVLPSLPKGQKENLKRSTSSELPR